MHCCQSPAASVAPGAHCRIYGNAAAGGTGYASRPAAWSTTMYTSKHYSGILQWAWAWAWTSHFTARSSDKRCWRGRAFVEYPALVFVASKFRGELLFPVYVLLYCTAISTEDGYESGEMSRAC